MDSKKIANVKSLNSNERLEYFIRKIADFERLWGSYGENGWLQLFGENEKKVMPFWPEKRFVDDYNIIHGYMYLPKEIDLYYFLDNWIDGLEKDEIDVLLFPVEGKSTLIIDPLELKSLLKSEMEQYE